MALFRVYGLRDGDAAASIVVECDSEAVARNAAVREGFVNTTRIELVEGTPDEGVVKPKRFSRGSRPRDLTKLDRQPVWTIAKGVFVGLALWTGFMIAVAWVLGVLETITG
ncbi:MAG: hypothetical protein AAF297_09315 [Planctomycetota bacterium]